MTAFDGGAVVEPMICKLPQAGFDGIIPEPTTVQVQEFLNARAREAERLRKLVADAPEGEELDATLKRMGPEQATEAVQRNAKMYAALCSDTPSADDLAKLPHRIFAAFANWLTEEILNPEAGTGGGSGQG